MITYKVGDKLIRNTFIAHYESYKSGKPVTFHVNEELYDQFDWTKEPEQSMEQLMDSHAINLRNKYDKIILGWSGGTDSQTIYNVFKRNNLHIDEIFVKYSEFEGHYPKYYVDWLLENHEDKTTIITPLNQNDLNLRSITLENEDWLLTDKADLLKFGLGGVDYFHAYYERKYGGQNWAVVNGLEKPNIHLHQTPNGNRWVSTLKDAELYPACHVPNLECFFLEPLLLIKASHQGKRWREMLMDQGEFRDMTQNFQLIKAGPQMYRSWATAVGRHLELVDGTSYSFKSADNKWKSTEFDSNIKIEELGRYDPYLDSKLKEGNPVALNYAKGFYNLLHEKDFMNYLSTSVLRSPKQLLKLKLIRSKFYDLGPVKIFKNIPTQGNHVL